MDVNEQSEMKNYKDVPKEEIRAFRKEYYTRVNPRAKVLWMLGIALMLPAIATAAAGIYFLSVALFTNEYKTIIWIMMATTILLGFISISLSQKHFSGFFKWLYDEKKIISAEGPSKKEKNRESPQRIFSELTKEEQAAHRKEYRTTDSNAKFWKGIIAVCLITGIIAAVFIIFCLIRWIFYDIYTTWIWNLCIGVLAFGGIAFWGKTQIMGRKFWNWLEYEKNIVKER